MSEDRNATYKKIYGAARESAIRGAERTAMGGVPHDMKRADRLLKNFNKDTKE
jgi:hypothetical protein